MTSAYSPGPVHEACPSSAGIPACQCNRHLSDAAWAVCSGGSVRYNPNLYNCGKGARQNTSSYLHAAVQLPSHVPSPNDTGQQLVAQACS